MASDGEPAKGRGEMTGPRRRWLVRPGTVRGLWIAFGAVLVLTLLADLLVARHPHFPVEDLLGFFAWYGFGSCVVMVLLSRALGRLLKRPDTYYDD
jgi:hypothetical protein